MTYFDLTKNNRYLTFFVQKLTNFNRLIFANENAT